MPDERLWAPWRLGYIIGEKDIARPCDAQDVTAGGDADCFLCRAVPPGDDRQRLVVSRSANSIVVLNRYPYNNGHLLVAPLGHVARLDGLCEETMLDISQTVVRMIGILEKTMKPQGFNVGLNLGRAAGAGLPGHLHWHIVPRWIGDTNFMPSVAGVRAIPQSLEALYELLAVELNVT